MAHLKLQKYAKYHNINYWDVSCNYYYSYSAAETDCTMSITIDPLYVKAYLRRGVARQQMNQLDAALKGIY